MSNDGAYRVGLLDRMLKKNYILFLVFSFLIVQTFYCEREFERVF